MHIEKIRRRKVETVAEPMFPRYLFIRLDRSGQSVSWSPIRSTIGVSQLVYFGSNAAEVDNELVKLLRSKELAGPRKDLFKHGDSVVITEGPFAGIEAIFQTANGKYRSMILLDILSRYVQLQIDTALLRKAHNTFDLSLSLRGWQKQE